MTPFQLAADEVRAAALFASEARVHWRRVAADADRDAALMALEAAADVAQKRAAAEELARGLGVPAAAAPALSILLHSPTMELRERAGQVLCKALRRRQVAA